MKILLNKAAESIEIDDNDAPHANKKNTHRRSKRRANKKLKHLTCTLYIQSDPIIWDYVTSVMKYNVSMIIKYITRIIRS